MKAIVTVELNLHGENHMRRFLNLVTQEAAVTNAYAVTGEVDVVLFLRLQDMEELNLFCDKMAQQESNIARFVTMMVIRTAKEKTAVQL